jgi:hypothetical protein
MRTGPDPDLTARTLLREAAALRAVGRRLLDDARADDVVQDTFVAALRGAAPREGLGAWLGGIARRVALPAADVVMTTEYIQLLATAVHELAEPYRTTIVLRFLTRLAASPDRRAPRRAGEHRTRRATTRRAVAVRCACSANRSLFRATGATPRSRCAYSSSRARRERSA